MKYMNLKILFRLANSSSQFNSSFGKMITSVDEQRNSNELNKNQMITPISTLVTKHMETWIKRGTFIHKKEDIAECYENFSHYSGHYILVGKVLYYANEKVRDIQKVSENAQIDELKNQSKVWFDKGKDIHEYIRDKCDHDFSAQGIINYGDIMDLLAGSILMNAKLSQLLQDVVKHKAWPENSKYCFDEIQKRMTGFFDFCSGGLDKSGMTSGVLNLHEFSTLPNREYAGHFSSIEEPVLWRLVQSLTFQVQNLEEQVKKANKKLEKKNKLTRSSNFSNNSNNFFSRRRKNLTQDVIIC